MSMHPRHVMAKAARHLIPFLILCYLLSYLDRVNIGFAALTMNKDLGLSANAFGFGASIFFLGYFLFEVPSNLLLEKFGARIWAMISLGQDLLLEHIPPRRRAGSGALNVTKLRTLPKNALSGMSTTKKAGPRRTRA